SRLPAIQGSPRDQRHLEPSGPQGSPQGQAGPERALLAHAEPARRQTNLCGVGSAEAHQGGSQARRSHISTSGKVLCIIVFNENAGAQYGPLRNRQSKFGVIWTFDSVDIRLPELKMRLFSKVPSSTICSPRKMRTIFDIFARCGMAPLNNPPPFSKNIWPG